MLKQLAYKVSLIPSKPISKKENFLIRTQLFNIVLILFIYFFYD